MENRYYFRFLLCFLFLTFKNISIAQNKKVFLGTYSYSIWNTMSIDDKDVQKAIRAIPSDSIRIDLYFENDTRLVINFIKNKQIFLTKHRKASFEGKILTLKSCTKFAFVITPIIWRFDTVNPQLRFEENKILANYQQGGMVFLIVIPFGSASFNVKDEEHKRLDKI